MECLIGIGSSTVGTIGQCTVSLAGPELGFCFYYKRNFDNLENEVQQIKIAKERIQRLVDGATRNLEDIEARVQDWLCKVSETIEEVESFIVEHEEQLANTRCHNRLCQNLLSRYQLSKKANRMTQRIVRFIRAADGFNTVSYPPILQSNFDDRVYKVFDTRKGTLTSIMAALRDPDVRLIGVHGMAGVGKTMLAKEVARQARGFFSEVIMVTVSQIPSWRDIQQEIGDILGLTRLDEQTSNNVVRASLLQTRLRNEKKVLLILDDLWQKVDLQEVGISFGDDQETCKILITSRSRQVLCDDMGIESNFNINVLSDKEADDMFNEIVGDVRGKSDFQTLATQIVKECAGLPLAIGKIASALKNKGLYEWRNALTELKGSTFGNIDGMEENVYKSIKVSYDFLRSEEAQALFLLCSIQEEDANMHLYRLLIQAIGCGLFQGVFTLEEKICRLQTLVDKLKARYLLLEGDNYFSVKMHDVVRDVGILIASKDKCMFNIRSNLELEQSLKKKKLEGSTAISIQYHDVDNLPEVLKCEQLNLLLMGKQKSTRLPDSLFELTKNLGHIDLSYTYLRPIPSSFRSLQNLQSLVLENCKVGDVAIIGELKSLEALCLTGSDIEELPEQIGQLTCLQLLDLYYCSRLKVIKPNVISKLTRLEELYLLGTNIQWEVEGFNYERMNASLTELKNLVQLRSLDIHISETHNLPKNLFKNRLGRFFISIEDQNFGWHQHKFKRESLITRSLKLGVKTSQLVEELGLGTLMKRSEVLHLDGMDGFNIVRYGLDAEGFLQLKHLIFQNNEGCKYIVDTIYQRIPPCNIFQSLESLTLQCMYKLERICHGKLEVESFRKLKVIEIYFCDKMIDLFSASVAKLLVQLEKIEVKRCMELKDIVTDDGQSVDNERIFPQMHSLSLVNVPELQEFYSLTSSEGTIPAFFNGKLLASSSCFKHLTKMVIDSCDSMKYIFLSSAPSNLTQLNSLVIRNCSMIEEIIKTDQAMDELLFPHLDSLTLENLSKLTRFCAATSIEFPSLVNLRLSKCPEMTTFASVSASTNLSSSNDHNEEIEMVVEENLHTPTFIFNDNVTFPSLQKMKIEEIDKIKMIWQNPPTLDSFCKLEEMEVVSCKNLRKMLPSCVLRRLRNLKGLKIRKCELLEEVFEMIQNSNDEAIWDHVIAIPLIDLKLLKLPNLKHVWSRDPKGNVTFEKLQKVVIAHCPSLKSLFPVSVAKGLHQLRFLFAVKCRIREIVVKAEEVETQVESFVFPKLISMRLEQLPELASFYRGLYTSKWPSLKKLKVNECAKAHKVFARELSSFQNDIPIQQDSLFSLDKIISFSELESLELSSSSFERVWDYQLRGGSTNCFQNLRQLFVENCEFLRHLFSSTVALILVQLNELEIKGCNMMEEVIISTDESTSNVNISFPKLNCLKLEQLPKLTRFSSGTFVINFPSLTDLLINGCPKLKTFIANSESQRLSFFDERVAIPNLEKMELRDMDCLKLVWHDQLIAPNSFCKLEKMRVNNCANLETIFSSNMLGKFCSLKKLAIQRCYMLGEVAVTLEKIWDENHHQGKSLPSLEVLILFECGRLKKLGPSSMPFQNLTSLIVLECHGVANLFTPRTAKGLTQLREISVSKCKQIIEIIATDEKEEETDDQGEICFDRLENLLLDSLPNLTVFCSGSYRVRFPNLKNVTVSGCPEMMSFSRQFTSTPKLNKLKLDLEVKWHIDHIMKKVFYGDTESNGEHFITKDKMDNDWSWLQLTAGDLNNTIQELRIQGAQDMGVSLQKLFAEN